MFMMMIHLNYIHIIHVRYSNFLCCTNFVYFLYVIAGVDRMVGKGLERPRPPASTTGRGGSIIPPQPLRRALLDSMQTAAAGPSSSAGRGWGRTKKASRGGRGSGRGRK